MKLNLSSQVTIDLIIILYNNVLVNILLQVVDR